MASMNSVLFARETRRGAVNMPRDYPKQAYRFVTSDMKLGVLKLYRLMDPKGFAGWEDRLRTAAGHVPTLVIWGDKDPYIKPNFADHFGTTNVHHFADAGHWPMLEKPAEVAELLAKHFAD
jgi:pimeloyl-ACP methyl ester carboxylesterase